LREGIFSYLRLVDIIQNIIIGLVSTALWELGKYFYLHILSKKVSFVPLTGTGFKKKSFLSAGIDIINYAPSKKNLF